MDKQIVHEEEVHGYGYHRLIRIVETKEKYSQPHARARAKHYKSAGRVDEQPCQQRRTRIRVCNLCRSREDPALSHEAPRG